MSRHYNLPLYVEQAASNKFLMLPYSHRGVCGCAHVDGVSLLRLCVKLLRISSHGSLHLT